MPRYFAFLRAINISGRYLKMEPLRRLFESLGLENVTTYIQSGNVVFETSHSEREALEAQIEAHLLESLGYPVPTFLRTDQELLALANDPPYAGSELENGATLYVSFLRNAPDTALQEKLLAYANEIDSIQVHNNHVFWLWRRQLGVTNFSNAVIERVLEAPATMRNHSTVQKMAAKYF